MEEVPEDIPAVKEDPICKSISRLSWGRERERYSQIQVGTCGSVAAVWHAGGDPQGAGRGHMNRRGALLQRPAGGGTLVPPCRVS